MSVRRLTLDGVKDETAAWLDPILERAEAADLDVNPLTIQALMPAAETTDPAANATARFAAAHAPQAQVTAADWVRFGHLVQDALGEQRTWPRQRI
jgi:hypothetical protein